MRCTTWPRWEKNSGMSSAPWPISSRICSGVRSACGPGLESRGAGHQHIARVAVVRGVIEADGFGPVGQDLPAFSLPARTTAERQLVEVALEVLAAVEIQRGLGFTSAACP